MRWDDLSEQPCSMSRSLAVLGDRWTLLILRDCSLRIRRFEAFQASLGIARRVLTERIDKLVGAGVLASVPHQKRPQIGRAHVCTTVTNALLVCLFLLAKNKTSRTTSLLVITISILYHIHTSLSSP